MSVASTKRLSDPAARVCGRQTSANAKDWLFSIATVLLLLVVLVPREANGEETNAVLAMPARVDDTNAQAILQAFLQIEQQIRATQLAIEENRREIKEATAQQSAALGSSLQAIQDNFAGQRARDFEAMQAHNKLVLVLVTAFAAMGFLTLLMMSYFQWRMSRGLAEISAALPAALGVGVPPPALNAPNPRLLEASGPSARPGLQPALKPTLERLTDHDTSFRRREVRAMRTAVIVGLLCAAALALLFYFVSYRKLGFGFLHGWFGG